MLLLDMGWRPEQLVGVPELDLGGQPLLLEVFPGGPPALEAVPLELWDQLPCAVVVPEIFIYVYRMSRSNPEFYPVLYFYNNVT